MISRIIPLLLPSYCPQLSPLLRRVSEQVLKTCRPGREREPGKPSQRSVFVCYSLLGTLISPLILSSVALFLELLISLSILPSVALFLELLISLLILSPSHPYTTFSIFYLFTLMRYHLKYIWVPGHTFVWSKKTLCSGSLG